MFKNLGSDECKKVAKTRGVSRCEKVVFGSKVRRSWFAMFTNRAIFCFEWGSKQKTGLL